MKVCICRNICEKAFKEAAEQLPPEADALDVHLKASDGVGPNCGKCLTQVATIRDGQALLPS